jgi:site-specific DNA recombinase
MTQTTDLEADPVRRLIASSAHPRRTQRAEMPLRSADEHAGMGVTGSGENGVIRVAAYARYSSHGQDDSWSIEAQHKAHLREAALHDTWRLTHYDDLATSAFSDEVKHRPALQRLLRDVAAGRVDLVVVHKLDRWSRSNKLTLQLIDELHQHGVGFLSISERFDLTTPYGWLGFHQHATLAEFFARLLSVEVRKGKEARASAGLHGVRVAYGYRSTGPKTPAEPDIRNEVDERGRPLGEWYGLLLILELLAQNLPDQVVADRLNADGRFAIRNVGRRDRYEPDRRFTAEFIASVRRNVYYRAYTPGSPYGTVIHRTSEARTAKGGGRAKRTRIVQEYPGQHVAAIGFEEWQLLQDLAANRMRGFRAEAGGRRARRPEPYTAEFRGVAACASCGARLYVYRQIHEDGRTYERYHCPASKRGLPCPDSGRYAYVKDVRAVFRSWLDTLADLPADWQEQVRAYAVAQAEQQGGRVMDAARERVRLQAKLRALAQTYTDLLIEEHEYKRRKREFQRALERLENDTVDVEQREHHLIEAGAYLTSLPALWDRATTEERQRVAGILMEPLGLRVRLLGERGRYNRRGKGRYVARDADPARLPSCEINETPKLRAPYAEALTATGVMSEVG